MNISSRKAYPSDVTDAQWALILPVILQFENRVRPDPEATANFREIYNALCYHNRTGCQWDMLPHDFPPKSTVYDYFTKWRDRGVISNIARTLREQMTAQAPTQANSDTMLEPTPSAACIDSQTVKTTEMGSRTDLCLARKVSTKQQGLREEDRFERSSTAIKLDKHNAKEIEPRRAVGGV